MPNNSFNKTAKTMKVTQVDQSGATPHNKISMHSCVLAAEGSPQEEGRCIESAHAGRLSNSGGQLGISWTQSDQLTPEVGFQ